MTQKEFAALGGRARAKVLTKDQRIEYARKAGIASALKRASKLKQCQSDGNAENKVK